MQRIGSNLSKGVTGAVVAAVATLLPGAGLAQLSTLVPLDTVSLAPPLTCGDVTVFDADDVATLCVDPSLTIPLVVSSCPQTVGPGFFRLANDVVCADNTAFIVVADNTIIDLNGHKVVCTGAGFKGSCQGPGAGTEPDVGVDTGGHNNVHVFSHVPGGTINGFDRGIDIKGGSNVKVKQLTITGPPSSGRGTNPRPQTQGIHVMGVTCGGGNIHLGGGVNTGNDVSNHTEGIELEQADCVEIGHNLVHDNNSDPFECHGIVADNSAHNNIHGNDVEANGEDLGIDGGLTLQGLSTTDSIVTNNVVSNNNGDGISARRGAFGNQIVNNTMLFNGVPFAGSFFFDAASGPQRANGAAVNFWDFNNVCNTQTTPEPPPGVCGPTEGP